VKKTVTEHIRKSLLDSLGYMEPAERLPDLPVLYETEQCPEFRRLRDARLILGAFRYGRFGDPRKAHYDHVRDMIRRLCAYEFDGNLEHLLDVANLCEVEWATSRHPKRHYRPTDDTEHTPVVR
jgi:hypothetical protein